MTCVIRGIAAMLLALGILLAIAALLLLGSVAD